MVFFSARREDLVILSSRNKNQKGHKAITMDASKCKIFPAIVQKTRMRTLSRMAYFLQRAQRAFVLFSKYAPLLSHFGSDSSMSKCGSSSHNDWLSWILLLIICAHAGLHAHALLLTLGGWVPSVPTQSEPHGNLHLIFWCARVWEGEARTKHIDNSEHQWEKEEVCITWWVSTRRYIFLRWWRVPEPNHCGLSHGGTRIPLV